MARIFLVFCPSAGTRGARSGRSARDGRGRKLSASTAGEYESLPGIGRTLSVHAYTWPRPGGVSRTAPDGVRYPWGNAVVSGLFPVTGRHLRAVRFIARRACASPLPVVGKKDCVGDSSAETIVTPHPILAEGE